MVIFLHTNELSRFHTNYLNQKSNDMQAEFLIELSEANIIYIYTQMNNVIFRKLILRGKFTKNIYSTDLDYFYK